MSKPKPLTDAHATLGALLRRPYESMSDWLYGELAAAGYPEVRPAYSVVLRNLPADGANVTALAARAGMTKQSMGYLVERMTEAKLVAVVSDEADRRAKTVRLTARGTKVVSKGVELSRRYEAHLAHLVGARKATQLRELLVELGERLEDEPLPADGVR